MFKDNPDFYPTPRELARLMLSRIKNEDARYFLEPSAGKGDIADVIKDLLEKFNVTAAAGKKWLGEDTQQYRPTKKREDADWYCSNHGHNFIAGICERCGDPEIDEVAAVACELCRAIFEHTGRKHCPVHEERPPLLDNTEGDNALLCNEITEKSGQLSLLGEL